MMNFEKSEKKGLNFYPIWFSNEKGIIKPQLLAKELEVEKGIICFQKNAYSSLLKSFREKRSKDEEAPSLLGAYEGRVFKSTVIYRAVLGAPATAILAEILIASGVKKIILFGAAGSISRKCRTGDIFIPTWGLREEGVSYHYFPPKVLVEPSENLLKIIRKSMGGKKHLKGGVWTTDVFFRETKEKIKKYAEKGILAVEMECTALMSVAMYRGVDLAAILVITDETFGDKWKSGFKSKKVKRAETTVAQIITNVFSGN